MRPVPRRRPTARAALRCASAAVLVVAALMSPLRVGATVTWPVFLDFDYTWDGTWTTYVCFWAMQPDGTFVDCQGSTGTWLVIPDIRVVEVSYDAGTVYTGAYSGAPPCGSGVMGATPVFGTWNGCVR